MNRYMIICRLRWPALLLLTGIIALLDQAHILSWGRAWPLYLILLGVLALAERATLAQQPPAAAYDQAYAYGAGYPAGYQAGYGVQPGPYGSPAASVPPAAPSTSIVPVQDDLQLRENKPFTGNAGKEEEGR
jgi:hypothetical protein